MSDGPLIVQSDKTLLLDVDHPLSVECRRAIAPFAELERSPEHIHTYRLTNLGLWNARAAGHDAEQVIDTLIKYSRYAVPHSLLVDVAETMSRIRIDPRHHHIYELYSSNVDHREFGAWSMGSLNLDPRHFELLLGHLQRRADPPAGSAADTALAPPAKSRTAAA